MPDTTTPAAPKASSSAKAKAAAPRRASSAGASKARATRTTAARSRGASKSKPAAARTSSTRRPTDLVGDYAERAVLIPVGAALLARERVVSSVTDAISIYSSPAKTQSQLRRFEHRGSAARTRMEREVRKTRTRVERELRERRRELDQRRERLAKEVTSRVEQTQSQIEKTQSQIEDALRTRLEEGADLASRVQERVLSFV
jgi:chromosome segregation ATPase